VLHPLRITVIQVPADGLNVTAVVTHGKPLALRLELHYLDPVARALLAYKLFQPDSPVFQLATLGSSATFSWPLSL
jgi:hypothetical protein